jgi:hypothetical protein
VPQEAIDLNVFVLAVCIVTIEQDHANFAAADPYSHIRADFWRRALRSKRRRNRFQLHKTIERSYTI